MAAIPPGQDTAEQGETPAACLRPSEQHKVISYNISSAIMSQVANYPKWSDLPLDKSHPPNSAWFVWGKEDELGCLVSWSVLFRNTALSSRPLWLLRTT